MSLSERLARAAQQREGSAVVDRASPVTAAAPDIEVSVIVAGTTPVAAVEPDPAAEPGSLCPSCSRPGIVGLVDLPRRTTGYNCSACGAMWSVRTLEPLPRPGSTLPPMRG